MVAGLLTVALLLFTFAQAAVVRNEGQSAADAAALAAARDARDRLFEDFLGFLEPDEDGDGDLGDIVGGDDLASPTACEVAAPRLADRNGARVVACALNDARDGYTVRVETLDTVGESLIPGTENETAVAEATAVVRARCELSSEEPEEEDRVDLRCDESPDWSLTPGEDGELPEARDLFDIYLED